MRHASKLRFVGWGSLLALTVTLAAAPQQQNAKPANPPKKSENAEPLPDGPMKEAATTACTECHDTTVILEQRLSKAQWTKLVDKMIKWGATVDPKDHDPLIDYFSSNFPPDKPPYEPPKGSDARNSK